MTREPLGAVPTNDRAQAAGESPTIKNVMDTEDNLRTTGSPRPIGMRIRIVLGLTAIIPLLMAGGALSLSPALDTRGFAFLAGIGSAFAMGALMRAWIGRALADSSKRVHDTTARLRELVIHHGKTLEHQAATLRRMYAAMAELEEGASSIAEASHTLAGDTDVSTRATESGNETAANVQQSVIGVRDDVQVASKSVARLDRRSDEIDMILNYMDHLSAEMTLLSRAAEADDKDDDEGADPRHQQVQLVAIELRQLAELVTEASRDIHRYIREIRGSSAIARDVTADGAKKVETVLHSFGGLESGLSEIRSSTLKNSGAAHRIEELTARQSISLNGVSECLGALNRKVGESEGETRELVEAIGNLANLGDELVSQWTS